MAIWASLGKYKDAGLFILRVGLGIMMITHGFPKISGGPATWEKIGLAMGTVGIHFLPTFWGFMAAVTEAVGGLFLLIGLWTRPTVLLLAITMVVASVMHLKNGDGLQTASHAIELFFVFIGLLFIGPGRYSVDKR